MTQKNIRVNFNRNADIIEITIRDATGRKINHWKISSDNKAFASKILKHLKEMYDFSPEIQNFSDKNWWE